MSDPIGERRHYPGISGVVMALFVTIAIVGCGAPAGKASTGWVEQGRGGSWTNVDVDTLAQMLATKDFTLVNVKNPYMGEIRGTDLYIPYGEVAARAAQLPPDKATKILVYCRSGNESRVAAQSLLDLGYTNVWNLDKGMASWLASGRALIQKPRS